MKYKTTLIKCAYVNNKNDKTAKEYNLPEMTPPDTSGGWSVVNFQPCASQGSYDSAYLVLWGKDDSKG